LSSRSSSNEEPLELGRVLGHRGRGGEITIRILSGDAQRWTGLSGVLLDDGSGGRARYDVDGARAYRDRLVLALRGIEDADRAAGLRGRTVWAPAEEVPDPGEGRYYFSRLVGLLVREESGETVGRVDDVLEASGNDLLVVRDREGAEVLVPLVREIVVDVREEAGEITVRLPQGLRELNARPGKP
jgi:16S rRNA processing protein RimM